MKRSDAIKIIQFVLDNHYDYKAITILQKLEDAGMIPPGITKYYDLSEHEVVSDCIFEWEPEDGE